jgi:hypothetical protein
VGIPKLRAPFAARATRSTTRSRSQRRARPSFASPNHERASTYDGNACEPIRIRSTHHNRPWLPGPVHTSAFASRRLSHARLLRNQFDWRMGPWQRYQPCSPTLKVCCRSTHLKLRNLSPMRAPRWQPSARDGSSDLSEFRNALGLLKDDARIVLGEGTGWLTFVENARI